MAKKRVQEIAKELGVKPKEVIETIKRWSPEKKKWSNFSTVDDDLVEIIYNELGEPGKPGTGEENAEEVAVELKEPAVAVDQEKDEETTHEEDAEGIELEEKPIEEVVAEVLEKEINRQPKEEEEKVKEVVKKLEEKSPPKHVQKPKEEFTKRRRDVKKEEKVSNKEGVKEKKEKKQPDTRKKEVKKEIKQQKPQPKPQKPKKKEEEELKIIYIPESITVRELSELLDVPANKVIGELLKKGVLANINQSIDPQVALEIAEGFGFLADLKKEEAEEVLLEEEEDKPEDLKPRPPIVVVMGHVDHGKTTLLDTIRKTKVAEKEKGGITQHIGAYMVELKDGRKITFLDTPGHEAFTSLRARGAQVTDVAILVVAADDGVMPQTVEAINHAKTFEVPIVVAVNKIDKPNADPMRVRRELAEHGLIPEDWGGDTVFVDVSAKTGEGIDQLLEMVLLVSDILELKANPNKRAKGVIIESKLDRKRGVVASVIVQEGTLRVGDIFVAGITHGRVRAMFDHRGRQVKEAPPSTPVEILGFEDLPEAGDFLVVVENERKAKQIAESIREKREKEEKSAQGIKLEEIFKKIESGETKELRLIIKADAIGSLEALKKSMEELSSEKATIRIIHGAVGGITENDVMLAKASEAIIIGFNTRPDPVARKLIEKEKVDVKLYGVIYQAIEDVKKALQGLLEPVEKEEILGSAEVRATFKIKKAGVVAGCYVVEGKVVRGAKARLIREGIVVYDGQIETLKRFKEDVQEVAKGYECGIKLKDFNDIKVGDIIECYEIKLEQPEL